MDKVSAGIETQKSHKVVWSQFVGERERNANVRLVEKWILSMLQPSCPTPAEGVWNRSCPHMPQHRPAPGPESWAQSACSLGLPRDVSSSLLSPSLCPHERFTKRLRCSGQAIAVATQPSQGLSVNESETCGLNFPQNWIHMDWHLKGKILFSKTLFEF